MAREQNNTRPHLPLLGETAQMLSQVLQEPAISQSVLHQVVSILAAQGALLGLLSPDGTELLQAGALGLSETYLHKGPVTRS